MEEGGWNRGSEEKGHAAEMNVCCCNGKLLMIAVLYTVLWPLLCNNNVFNVYHLTVVFYVDKFLYIIIMITQLFN